MKFAWSFGAVIGDAPQSAQLRPGSLFAGQFRIETALGEGAMGSVFLAHDLQANRPVALKVMRDALDPRRRARFFREGELIAKLNHPGILRIHAGGVTDCERPFLALEVVEGGKELDEAFPTDPRRRLQLLFEVARAVGYAHSQGVVHRDLKPANVLVGADGRARVCDFGIGWATNLERLTKTGELVGTPVYMAPECLSSKTPELRVLPTVDVWALGVMLYTHLTDGLLPFDGTTLTELLSSIASARFPSPRSVKPSVSPELEAVCLRALALEPSDRFADANAFADALDLALVSTRRSWRPSLSVAAAVSLATLATLLLVNARGGSPGAASGLPPTAATGDVEEAAPSEDLPPSVDLATADWADLQRRSHELVAFHPRVAADFDRIHAASDADPVLQRRILLERQKYLFRHGRWLNVVQELPALAQDEGPTGVEATLLLGLAIYSLQFEQSPLGKKTSADLRRRWEASEKPEELELACGAWHAVFERDNEAAVTLARQARERDPELVPALLAEAVALGRLQEIAQAQEVLERVQALVPDHPTALVLLGLCSAHFGRSAEAVALTELALKITGPQPPWMVCLATLQCLVPVGGVDRIEELAVRELRIQPDNPNWRFALGWVRMQSPDRRWRGLVNLRSVQHQTPRRFEACLNGPFLKPTEREPLLAELANTPLAHVEAVHLVDKARVAWKAKDYRRELQLLNEAAEKGLPRAMYLLGDAHMLGLGTERDPKTAVRWYTSAAEGGDLDGIFSMGLCTQRGSGVEPNAAEAYRWYLRGARAGHARSMVNLGSCLQLGAGVAPDEDEALVWWERAAGQGDPRGMLKAGTVYWFRDDPRPAARHLRKALELGDPQVKATVQPLLRAIEEKYPELLKD